MAPLGPAVFGRIADGAVSFMTSLGLAAFVAMVLRPHPAHDLGTGDRVADRLIA